MNLKDLRLLILFISPLGMLGACGGGSDGADIASPPVGAAPPAKVTTPPALSGDAWQGRYVGAVMIGGVQYYGDALLTADGAIRLYVGAPYDDGGELQLSIPAGSAQLVGTLNGQTGQATGAALVFGQDCARAPTFRFCLQTGQAEVNIASNSGHIQGDVAVTTSEGGETWSLSLDAWSNYYVLPAAMATLAGHYQEALAEFALDGDTTVSIDVHGALSFDSAHSGCTGSGMVRPHLNGAVNVYDVSLTIEDCIAPYDYLNSAYVGLATTSPSSYWDYDVVLRVWLSQPGVDPSDSAPHAALMMSGNPQ